MKVYQVSVFLFVVLWVLMSCSSSKVSKKRPVAVSLPEKEQLEYDHEFMEATKLKLLGNIVDAAGKLTRCTEINPYDAAAYFQLAEIYTMAADTVNALSNARLAAEYAPENIWYNMQLAGLYVVVDKPDSAVAVYRKISELQPDNPEVQYNMALLYAENKNYRNAVKVLNKIEKTYGFSEELVIAKYRVYSKKNDVKAVESVLRKGVEAFPDDFRFYGLLAELYSATGNEKEAGKYYAELLDIDPENAVGYISMIEFYKDYGNDAKALEEMQRMYALQAIDPDLKVELYLSISSDSVFFRKHYKEMDGMIKQLFEKYPDNFRVRLVNTDRNLREKNFEGAKNDLLFLTDRLQTNYFLWEHLFPLLHYLQDNETLYESTAKALKYFDNRYLFRFYHGLSASMLKKYGEAADAYERTLECLKKEKEPDRDVELQTYVMLGDAYNDLKRYAESDAAFEKALSLSPNNPMVLNNYSYYLSLREDKMDLAEKYIKRCVAAEPDNSTYLDTYGWVLYKLGRIDEAIAMIEKAMKNGGNDNPEIIDHLCELLTVSGKNDEAYHVCKYAAELNNSKETPEQKMESIRERAGVAKE